MPFWSERDALMSRVGQPLASRRAGRLLALLALLAAPAALTGCIRSRVFITSEPPGAEVLWRGEPYGATPIEIPYLWYWHYDYALEKPGYERIDVVDRFRTPPWFLMPVDLFMEMLPIPIHDTRERHFVLTPREPTLSQLP